MAQVVFEIGGSNLRVARVEDGKPGAAKKFATPQEPHAAVSELVKLAHEVVGEETITHIAGGVPGTVSREGLVHRSPNLPKWDNFAFGEELHKALNAEVVVRNDADIGALGEANFGAGKDFDVVAFLVCGTGIGGSRVVGGRTDSNAYGFEPGQYIFDASTGATFEQMLSGRAIETRYGPPQELGRDVWDELTPTLARGLYTTMLFWSPHVIVLSGTVFLHEERYQLDALERELNKLNKIFPKIPEIRRGTLGDDAGLWGATVLLRN